LWRTCERRHPMIASTSYELRGRFQTGAHRNERPDSPPAGKYHAATGEDSVQIWQEAGTAHTA
jgi:hypothetical protein